MVVVQAALPHQGVGDRDVERLGQRRQLAGGPRRQHAAAGVEHRPLGVGERLDDALGGGGVEPGPDDRRRGAAERVDRQVGGEEVHRHVHQHRAGAAGLAQVEGAFHDPRQVLGAIDAVDALAERPVDLRLVGVLVEIDLLVRVPAVVVGLHVAGDDDHRDRVERGVGDAGGGVGQARAEVRQHDARLARGAGVAVGGVRRHLLVPSADEADAALAQRVEEADDRMAAQPEDHLDAEAFEVLGEQVGRDPRRRRGGPRHSGVAVLAHDIRSAQAIRPGSGGCRTRRRARLPRACPRESAGSPR